MKQQLQDLGLGDNSGESSSEPAGNTNQEPAGNTNQGASGDIGSEGTSN